MVNENKKFDYNSLKFSFETILQELEEERSLLLSQQGFTRADVESSTGRGKHSIVCRHWLKSMCMKGDFCDFLHQLNYKRMPICRSFAKKRYCADRLRGGCPFKHEDSGVSGSINELDNTCNVGGALPQNQECIHYFLGFCRLGPKCTKKHTPRSRNLLPSFLPDWYLDTIVVNKNVFPSKIDENTLGKIREITAACKELNTTRVSWGGKGKEDATRGGEAVSNASSVHVANTKKNARGEKRDVEGNIISSSITGEARKSERSDAFEEKSDLCNNKNDSSEKKSLTAKPALIPGLTDAFGVPAKETDKIRCFVIKCNQMTNIYYSIQYGIWATGKMNTRKLCNAFRECQHVVLLFSANESGGFQGYGRMMSLPINSLHENIWGKNISIKLCGNFRVRWLKQCKIDFDDFKDFTNPFNESLPLKKSRDGTELPLDIASMICQKMTNAPDEDLLLGTHMEISERINHQTFFKELAEKSELCVDLVSENQSFNRWVGNNTNVSWVEGGSNYNKKGSNSTNNAFNKQMDSKVNKSKSRSRGKNYKKEEIEEREGIGRDNIDNDGVLPGNSGNNRWHGSNYNNVEEKTKERWKKTQNINVGKQYNYNTDKGGAVAAENNWNNRSTDELINYEISQENKNISAASGFIPSNDVINLNSNIPETSQYNFQNFISSSNSPNPSQQTYPHNYTYVQGNMPTYKNQNMYHYNPLAAVPHGNFPPPPLRPLHSEMEVGFLGGGKADTNFFPSQHFAPYQQFGRNFCGGGRNYHPWQFGSAYSPTKPAIYSVPSSHMPQYDTWMIPSNGGNNAIGAVENLY